MKSDIANNVVSQNRLDMIYQNSLNGDNFTKIYKLVVSEENIIAAYNKIRLNKGSYTAGPDGATIEDVNKLKTTALIQKIQNRLKNYQPGYVRFVRIPKQNGTGFRTLGIKSIYDRISEQAIKQIIEPHFEAKFYAHSYGFRPYRSAKDALARCVSLINRGKMYYVVSIDIDNFFDNVDHETLKRKLWHMGIRDKKVISILNNMMKSRDAETGKMIDIGLAQGGVISPLLANVYLTELDMWVSSQWENFKIETKDIHSFHNNRAPKTNIKSGYIVRYADDFKIMCRSYDDANRFYHATIDMLKKRMKLDVNVNKSKVINLKRNKVTFLGFDIRAVRKGSAKNGWVANTHISDDALIKIKSSLTEGIKAIQRNNYTLHAMLNYNAIVRGIKQYYQYATHVYVDLDKIGNSNYRVINARLKSWNKKKPYYSMDASYKRGNVGLKKMTKISTIREVPLDVINAVHHRNPLNFSQKMTPYTNEGRMVHDKATKRTIPIEYVNYIYSAVWYKQDNIEYVNNRIRKYMSNSGKSEISGEQLHPSEMHYHHKKPKFMGGPDNYSNLALITKTEHKLIHATNTALLKQHLILAQLPKDVVTKLNKYRAKVGNEPLPKI